MTERDEQGESRNSWDYDLPDAAMVRGDRATDPGADIATAPPPPPPPGSATEVDAGQGRVTKSRALVLWVVLAAVGLAVVWAVAALAGDDSSPSEAATGPVPEVVGVHEASATDLLESQGFVVGEVTIDASTAETSGTVIGQRPVAGTALETGGIVDLVVAADAAQDTVGVAVRAVPSVVGLTEEEAHEALVDAGLSVANVSTRAGSDDDAGIVVEQDPAAGFDVEVPDGVSLVVSSGVPTELVPEVSGVVADDAEARLRAIGWEVEIRSEPHDTIADGVALTTEPAPRTRVPLGETITLVVSTGPAIVTLPDVVDQPALAASIELADLGLRVDAENCAESSQPVGIAPGNVAEQTPAAGTEVEAGSVVSLCIAVEPIPIHADPVPPRRVAPPADSAPDQPDACSPIDPECH
jgi:beta-lactam-binding protein with PASTA domain